MARPTFFGEVVPVISRAVDDEEEELDEEYCNLPSAAVIRWIPAIRDRLEASSDNKVACNVLIIALGDAGTSFVKTYVLQRDHEMIGTICTGMRECDENTLSQTSPTDKTCYVYRMKKEKQVLVCQCMTDVAAEQCYSWTQQFLSKLNLDSAYIAILNNNTVSNYLTPNPDIKTPFMRALKTVWFLGTPCCEYLESPNCVTGLAAQVLSYCEVNRVPAVLYNVYSDSIYLDTSTVKQFMRIAEWTPFKDVCVKNPDSDELLKKLVEQHQRKNPLYI